MWNNNTHINKIVLQKLICRTILNSIIIGQDVAAMVDAVVMADAVAKAPNAAQLL